MPARFARDRAPQLVRAARLDRGMSQAALARAAGMSQPNVAAVENGTRNPSEDAFERLLRAADYRPSVAVEEHADAIVEAGARHGLRDIRVFGSVATGADHFTSDIDLLARVDSGRGYFDIAAFTIATEELTGFPVDVIVDGETCPAFLASTPLVALTDPESPRAKHFERAPRHQSPDSGVAQENLLDSLDAIETLLVHATSGGRRGFPRNSSACASGSMAVIRAAALFETRQFADFLKDTPDEVVSALRTTRDIASHFGDRAVNDELLWVTLTVELPPYVAQWRRAGEKTASD